MEPSALSALRQVPLFAGLEDEALAALAARCRRRRFRAHEALIHEGDPGQTLYLILSGSVHIQRDTPEGETLHLARCGPGEPVGELSLIDGKPRMADVVTAEPCDVLILDRDEFLACLRAHPEMAIRVLSCLADRLRRVADHMEQYQTRDVLGRLAVFLVETLESGGADETPDGKRLRVQLSQGEIARQVGTTRESVNRALARLRQARAVRCEGRQWIVTDERKLRQFCVR
jgi:CRP/FNR family transcriptional regulator, cyclic AMP receptor protein